MSSRISQAIEKANREKAAAFIPYLTGCLPDLGASVALCLAFDRAGADVIEVGLPFSDPQADGPVIQKASTMALEAGATTDSVLEMVRLASAKCEAPILIMTYYNPVFVMGLDKFAEKAAEAGVAGILIPDLPPEEATPWLEAAQKAGLDTIFMAAPTTTPERLDTILKVCQGFLYYVSMTGVTGSDLEVGNALLQELAEVKAKAQVPVAVGFGIAHPEQMAGLAPQADGIVVGSALMRPLVAEGDLKENLAKSEALARELSSALSLKK